MAKDKEVKEEMLVEEISDGSAVVDLPDDIPSPDAVDDGSDENDEAAERAEIATLGSVDPEQEALREQRRNKRRARKEYHKQVATEKDTRLQLLQRQNQELQERLSIVERKTQGSEIARIHKAKEDQEARILFAKQKIKEATETGNGDLLTSAQEMWYEARQNHEALDNLIRQSTAQQQQRTIQAPDPSVQHYAGQFMMKNSWYNPNGTDVDSAIALKIDQSLADDGWDPKSSEYWEELDNRLQKYLPHRYTTENETQVSRPKPRSVVTSSGRESASRAGGQNTFTLRPEQVRAMKDAGMWDDPEKKMRMIRRYAQEARLK